MDFKLAVTSRSFCNNPILRAELLKKYSKVTFNETGRVLEGEELINFLKGHERAIIGLEKIDAQIIENLPELKVISKYGVGLDNLDLSRLQRHGVKLARSHGVNKRSVAELALFFALALVRRSVSAYGEVKNGKWRPVVGHNLTHKTFGIVGMGNIGQELTHLLQGFQCRILTYDIVDKNDFCRSHEIAQVSFEQLLHESDVISLHVPKTLATQHLIGETQMAMMKQGVYLINTARGGLIEEEALKRNLISGKIAGAGLDVFEVEPPLDQELIQHPNLICTPHTGGSTEQSILAMGRAAINGVDLAEWISDKEL